MATTKKTIETKNDSKDKVSIIEIIQDIDARLTHLEDMQTDNRDLTVKLVKQGNTVVEFLKDFQIEPVDMEDLEIGMSLPPLLENEEKIKLKSESGSIKIEFLLENKIYLKDLKKI